jgi:ABC-type Fe3+/spermidine/putrescine transport system ATPase subunit
MAAVAVAGLHKSFGSTPVLRDVSLSARDGEFLTLMGPSGSTRHDNSQEEIRP